MKKRAKPAKTEKKGTAGEDPAPHVEIKAREYVDATLARKLAEKGSVVAVVATGKITGKAKEVLKENNIAYVENVSEKTFQEQESERRE